MVDDPVLARARATWRQAIQDDDVVAAEARVQRLLRGRPTPPRAAVPGPVFSFALAVIAAVAVSGAARRAPSDDGAGEVVDTALEAPAANTGSAPDAVDVATTATVTGPCFGCLHTAGGAINGQAGGDGEVASGERLLPGDRIEVPAGSVLILCWGIDDRSEVVGPASVTVNAAGEPRVKQEPAEAPRGAPAAGPVAATSESIAASGGADTKNGAGGRDAAVDWRVAQVAVRAGRRAEAERLLVALVSRSDVPPTILERATFSLAELELARGATSDARALLHRVQRARDPELAADAIFLDARATPDPSARAELYGAYLAGRPPSPYREQALAERGLALAASGDMNGAAACASMLRAELEVPSVAAAAFSRLERALER
jgi:hypothetical protein